MAAPTQMGSTMAPAGGWSVGYQASDFDNTSALNILDRERYANLWLQGKRLFDLQRWDHAFVETQGWTTGSTSVANRVQCYPMARNECQLNPNLQGDPVCS